MIPEESQQSMNFLTLKLEFDEIESLFFGIIIIAKHFSLQNNRYEAYNFRGAFQFDECIRFVHLQLKLRPQSGTLKNRINAFSVARREVAQSRINTAQSGPNGHHSDDQIRNEERIVSESNSLYLEKEKLARTIRNIRA